jgi:hypothetical protein
MQEWSNLARDDVSHLRLTLPLVSLLVCWLFERCQHFTHTHTQSLYAAVHFVTCRDAHPSGNCVTPKQHYKCCSCVGNHTANYCVCSSKGRLLQSKPKKTATETTVFAPDCQLSLHSDRRKWTSAGTTQSEMAVSSSLCPCPTKPPTSTDTGKWTESVLARGNGWSPEEPSHQVLRRDDTPSSRHGLLPPRRKISPTSCSQNRHAFHSWVWLCGLAQTGEKLGSWLTGMLMMVAERVWKCKSFLVSKALIFALSTRRTLSRVRQWCLQTMFCQWKDRPTLERGTAIFVSRAQVTITFESRVCSTWKLLPYNQSWQPGQWGLCRPTSPTWPSEWDGSKWKSQQKIARFSSG